MKNNGTWTLLTLLAAICLGWGGANLWRATRPRPAAAPAPRALEWTPAEKEALLTPAFLRELSSDAALRQALERGPSESEMRRIKSMIAKYAVRTPPAGEKDPSCSAPKEPPKPASLLGPASPDGSCADSAPQPSLPIQKIGP